MKSVCVRCGSPKKRALDRCRSCGLEPQTEYQIARALILSAIREVGGVRIGRDPAALKTLAAQIGSGRFYEFDPLEEQRALEAYRIHEAQRGHRRLQAQRVGWALFWAAGVSVVGYWLFSR